MKSVRVLILTVLLSGAILLPAARAAAEGLRAGTFAVTAGFDLGEAADDPAAELFVLGEYALLERLSLGVGYAYLDGLHPLQAHCLKLSARGYLLGKPLDLFVLAALYLYFEEAGPGAAGTAKLGAEWATPWRLLLGAECGVLLEPGGVGWLVGGYLGLRV